MSSSPEKIWDCPSCEYSFDMLWSFNSLVWIPDALDHNRELMIEDVLSDIDVTKAAPMSLRFCCDQTSVNCKCQKEKSIPVLSPYHFFHNHLKVTPYAPYSKNPLSACQDCERYATSNCVPLRNVIRFAKENNYLLPGYSIVDCDEFVPDHHYTNSTSGHIY